MWFDGGLKANAVEQVTARRQISSIDSEYSMMILGWQVLDFVKVEKSNKRGDNVRNIDIRKEQLDQCQQVNQVDRKRVDKAQKDMRQARELSAP